jgi:DHA1 family multidrug resistance protein-like MFS transporter
VKGCSLFISGTKFRCDREQLLALGTAFVSPNLAALKDQGGGESQIGAALGIQNAANSLGQVLGSGLLIWSVKTP